MSGLRKILTGDNHFLLHDIYLLQFQAEVLTFICIQILTAIAPWSYSSVSALTLIHAYNVGYINWMPTLVQKIYYFNKYMYIYIVICKLVFALI